MSYSTLRYAVIAGLLFASSVHAAELRPDQLAAVEAMLQQMEPQIRPMFRAQLEASVAMMTPDQIKQFMAGLANNNGGANEPEPEPEPASVATPEDIEYNRKQYEPVARKHWEAKKAFDTYVDSQLAAKCPAQGSYAVYRSAERYEMMPVSANWHRAATNADLEVQVIGGAYIPQDGRYDFDFSKVRMTFDKQAVSAAIEKACSEWTKQAVEFKKKAGELMHAGKSSEALAYENSANSKVSAINEELTQAIDALSPASRGNEDMMNALMNPKRAR